MAGTHHFDLDSALVIRDFPADVELDFATVETALESAGNKHLQIAPGIRLRFKNQEDSFAFKFASSAEGLRMDFTGCTSVVRLQLALGELGCWLLDQARDGKVAAVSAELSLEASDSLIDWIAFLVAPKEGPSRFWNRVAEDIYIAGSSDREWRVVLPGEAAEGDAVVELGMQFSSKSGVVTILGTKVAPVAITTSAAGLICGGATLVGWGVPSESAASLTVSRDGFELASLPLFTPPSTEPSIFEIDLIDITRAAGTWKALPGCTASLVSGKTLLGQARIDLSARNASTTGPVATSLVRFDIPANAARLVPVLPASFLVRQAKEATADSVLSSSSGDAGRLVARELYQLQEVETLWRLRAELTRRADYAMPHNAALRAHIEFYYARSLLDLSAADSAYSSFKALTFDRGLVALLGAKERSRLDKIFIRACIRSGRIEEAEMQARQGILRTPNDWELYFTLAGVVLSTRPDECLALFEKVLELSNDLPASHLAVIIETLLATGQSDRASALAEQARAAAPQNAELALSFANIALANNNRPRWAVEIADFFKGFGLLPPALSLEGTQAGIPWVAPQNRASGNSAVVTPTIAVIMTAFNSEKYISSSIESVLAQSFADFRLIVVDDASTDSTADIVNAWAARDPRVTLIRQGANSGTYVAKNRAIRDTVAEYYAFIDSDDWMHPERLQRHLEFSRSDPGVACTMSNWIRLDLAGRASVRRAGGFVHENPASIFLPRASIEQIGFFDSVRIGADSEYVWRLRRRFGRDSVVTLPLPLTIGLSHDASLTRSGAAAFDEHRFSDVRMKYGDAWAAWHREMTECNRASELHMPFPAGGRYFPAPSAILP